VPCALGLIGVFHVTQAGAQEGFALNRFDPAERGSSWFRADSLDIAGHKLWAIGVIGDLADSPLVARDEDGNEIGTLIAQQFFVHAGASVVLFERLRLGLNAPLLVYQNAGSFTAPGVSIAPEQGAAVGDLRLGVDFRLLGEPGEAFTAAAGVRFHLPTGNQAAFASDGSLRVVPQLQVAGDIGSFVYAASTGVQIRTHGGDFVDESTGSELLVGAAAGLRLLDRRLVVGPEIYGSTVVADGGGGFLARTSSPFEVVLGAHYDVARDVRVGLGVGPGISQGLGAPKVRWLASVEWVPAAEEEQPLSDRDGDTITDYDDRCADLPGTAQSDPALHGCPIREQLEPSDRDGDAIADESDACPETPGPANTLEPEKHGCPLPLDEDGDAITDVEDACPAVPGVPNPSEPARHGCPIPINADADGDGINDDVDACPQASGVASDDPAKHGCSRAIANDTMIQILDRVEFESGKAQLRSESDAVLTAVAKLLEERPDITKLSVEGHTDSQGARQFNVELSRNRAAAVVAWLVDHGVAAARLTSTGLGPERPIDTNDNSAGRQANRRVEFRIVQLDSQPSTTRPGGQ
jgi:outer membrane protein OmpA-like peptidoglycan-associated protein